MTHTEENTGMADLTLHDAIFTTRAMRRLKTDPIPRVDLEYVIEAATMAPSAGNYQMWSFVVVSDRGLMAEMAGTHREVGLGYIRNTVLADPATDDDRRRVYNKAMHNVEHLDQAGAIIVACLTMAAPDDAGVASGLFGSIFPATQNLQLAARSRGLGSVLITLATDYSPILPVETKPVREIIGLPEDVSAVALLPIGYPEGNWGRPWREPWQGVTHWDRWSA
jgi:nitroreductase